MARRRGSCGLLLNPIFTQGRKTDHVVLDRAAIIAYERKAATTLPTIPRFAACKIAIYADDHMPPHFHIEGRDFRAVVEIETLKVRAGSIRRAPDAMAWARGNQAFLLTVWHDLNRRG